MVKRFAMKKIVTLVLTAAVTFSSLFSSNTVSIPVHAMENSADYNTVNDKMKMWYTSPANIYTSESNGGEWMQQSLPLGNGNLGNLIFGGISKERIHFNEKTLWTGGPSSSRPGYQFGNKGTAYTAEEIEEYRQILDDKSTNVFNDSMSGYGMGAQIRFPGENNLNKGSYQDFGDIWLDFSAMGMNDSNVNDYRRELDLQTGIASTRFNYNGVTYIREHFVSSPDNVMVTHVSASEKGKLDVTIQMELNNNGLSGNVSLDTTNNTCIIDGYVNDNGLKFRTIMKIIPVGGSITANESDKTYTLENADSFMLIMAAETDYKNDYPIYRDEDKILSEVVDGRVEECAQKSYEELKINHVTDHQGLFDRVSLDLGESETSIPTDQLVEAYRNGEYSKFLEVLSFQFGRYLTIAGSRGTLPSNLVGLWTVGDSAWTGDYHFNVNIQMNYWPVYVSNLAECGTTMVEYMESIREPGRLTAERVHGITDAVENHTGFTVHTENNPFGMTAPTNAQEYGWNPTGAAWAIQNIWAHYEFTQDEEYLRNVIYPIMKEAALFWDQYLWTSNYQVINDETSPYNKEKRLVVAPSFSEEQGPTAIGTTYDQSLVWELYNECIQAGKIVGEDDELLARWESNMQKLDPIEINATNGIKEWYEETRVGTQTGHNKSYAQAGQLEEIEVPNSGWNIGHPGEQRHASHLVGLYPGTLINKDNEEYMSAAIQSLTERGEYSTGWSKANKLNLWARTGDGNKAYRLLNNLIGGNAAGLQYNLFDSHGSGGGETMKNGSPVWQIDGNYGLTSGVAEMLIQSQLGYVQFLPAIPDAWDEGEVQGLKARGNFTIGQTWYNGVADEFTVCYEGNENSSEFIGEYAGITNARVYLDGEEIVVTKDEVNSRISFEAVQGNVYTISMSEANVEQIKEKAENFVTEIHSDLPEVKAELEEAIRTETSELNQILRKAKLIDKIYREYIEEVENIYYMTTEDGLTDKQIDSMYNQLRQLRAKLLSNTESYTYYQNAFLELQQSLQIMQMQINNRNIIFSKEEGVVNNDDNTLSLSTGSNAEEYDIRYTLDGTEPEYKSALYENAIQLNTEKNTVVRAALFHKKQRVSPVYTKQYTKGIEINAADTQVEDWGDEYTIGSLMDGDLNTRWATKSPQGDIEIVLSFDNAVPMNAIKFEQFVSYRNGTDRFEIWALEDGEYKKVLEGSELGDDGDNVGGNRAYKTVMFEQITTTSLKIILKDGYVGEPSFYEIQPLFIEEVEDCAGNPETLNIMIQLAESADRTSTEYINADYELQNSFEESILDAKDTANLTQSQMDSREQFLRNRYNRLGFGETDKSELEAVILEAEEAMYGDYTRDSLYRLNKQLKAAKVVFADETVKQPAVDREVDKLLELLKNLISSKEVSITISESDLNGENWIHVGNFMATNSDESGKLSYTFTGKQISVLTVKANDHGILCVVITNEEGIEVYNEEIDTYATERTEGVQLFEKALENGTYKITFERAGTNTQCTGQGWVEVGALIILQETVEDVDRSMLEALIAECDNLNPTEYVKERWETFQVVLEKAKNIYAKAENDTCTAEMEDMSEELAEAKKALGRKADAEISIESGKESYRKNFAEENFVLEGITATGDGKLTYTVVDGKDADGEPKSEEEILTVSEEGVVSLHGTGSATINVGTTETDNYFAAQPKQITVKVDYVDEFLVKSVEELTYTGKALKPEIRVCDGMNENFLQAGKDYTITYKNNTKAYTIKEGEEGFDASKAPQAVIKGKGNYSSIMTVYFTIQPKDISDLKDESIVVKEILLETNGRVQTKVPAITYNKKKLSGVLKTKNESTPAKLKDFVYSYPEMAEETTKDIAFKEAGTWTVLVEGTGNYTGSRTVEVVIAPKGGKMSSVKIAKIPAQEYNNGNPVELDESELIVTAKIDGKTTPLTKGIHYQVEDYKNNTNIGTATVIIKGIEGSGFAGTKTAAFKITGTSIAKATVTGIEDKTYTGSKITQNLMITVKKNVQTETGIKEEVITLTENDYDVVYDKDINKGTAKLTITGKGAYFGTLKKTFKIKAYDITGETNAKGEVKENSALTESNGLFTKKNGELSVKYVKGGAKPEVELVFNGSKLTEGKDYTITYKNNKNVFALKEGDEGYKANKAPTIIIKGKGSFKGSISKTFVITARGLQDSEVPVKMTVSDKAVSSKPGGYISKPVLIDADGKVLKQGKDYTAPVYTTTNAVGETITLGKKDTAPVGSKITVTVNGLNAYAGEEPMTATYVITEKNFTGIKAASIQKPYTGRKVILSEEDFYDEKGKSKITIGNGKNKEYLEYGKDFEIVEGSYKNNMKKGTASVTLRGISEEDGLYGGTKTIKFKIGTRGLKDWLELLGF